VSNLVAREWTEVWTQTSNTNTIPEVDWDSAFTMFWRKTEGNANPDAGTQLEYPNSGIIDWEGAGYSYRGSHVGPIGATNTSTRTWTNTWIQMPRPDISTARTNLYDEYLLYSWLGLAAADGDGFHAATDLIWTNSTVSVTNAFKVKARAYNVPNLYMSALDAVAIDSYHALAERWAIVQGDHDEDRTGILDYYKPTMGRTRRYRNLDVTKDFFESLLSSFVDPNITNDFTELFGTNYASIAAWSSFAPTATGLCAQYSIPTNYFDYTPPQLYALLPATDYGRIVTNSHVMVCTGTNACTNSVIDFEGDSRDLVGTNGQTVTVLSTNANVLSGYTLSDYGWKHMPTLITNGLRWIGGDYDETPTYVDAWSSADGPTWVAAKIAATNPAPLTKAGNWTTGILNDDSPDLYIARWYSSSHAVTAKSSDNIEATVDIYVYADIDGATPFTLGSNVWDDALFPALVQDRMALVTNLTTSSSQATTTLSTTNRGAWCAEPTGYGVTNQTWRGYIQNYGKKRALYRYDDYLDNN
jgi:hypothetical protein